MAVSSPNVRDGIRSIQHIAKGAPNADIRWRGRSLLLRCLGHRLLWSGSGKSGNVGPSRPGLFRACQKFGLANSRLLSPQTSEQRNHPNFASATRQATVRQPPQAGRLIRGGVHQQFHDSFKRGEVVMAQVVMANGGRRVLPSLVRHLRPQGVHDRSDQMPGIALGMI